MSFISNECSRRQFLKTTGAAGLGLLASSAAADFLSAEEPPRVPTRPFGKTGANVAILSMGGMFDIPNNQLMLRQAVKWGVTYWDTANSYEGGNSELGIGKYFAKYPEDRKSIFLVTKSTAWTLQGMTEHLNLSLERMRTDHVDLFFVHSIRSIASMDKDRQKWGEKAKAEGKIRFFGFSTHSNMEECLLGAAPLGWIDGIMMTYNYRLMHTDKMRRAVDACAGAGIGLTAMKTQGGGQVLTNDPEELKLAGRFVQGGFTEGQARLKAVWENPQIASICSQMPSMALLSQNTAAAVNRARLSAGERKMLDQHAQANSAGYCAGCTDICEPALAAGVPVGRVMRYLMYCRNYGNRDFARSRFRALPAETRAVMDRLDYTAAEARCPQRMPIGRLMREALIELA
ncbi:MAG TPA: aldo/keto reductase [Desulfobacterales bacterium]|nr:aldo/keto reductase [Desulfobacterales bacterium]